MKDWRLTLSSADGGAACCVTLQFDDERAEPVEDTASLSTLERLEEQSRRCLNGFIHKTVSMDSLRELGRELAALLLPHRVGAVLDAALSSLGTAVLLRLSNDHERLQGLPWEYAYLGEATGEPDPNRFLGLHPSLRLVRQMGPLRSVEPVSDNPLRVLIVVSAAPPGAGGLLHAEAEAESVLGALKGIRKGQRLEVKECAYASRVGLRQNLERFKPHILHFIGHGTAKPLSGGVLLLYDGELTARDLADWLPPNVRLVVLSACRTASPARGKGTAETLMERGVPAVVAMQLPVRDPLSPSFSRELYSALAENRSLTEAVHQARSVIQGAGPDWGVPALYLSARDDRLFRPLSALARPVPFTVPYPRNRRTVRREALLQTLHALLSVPDGAPVALCGLGGVGKTQLAVEYAYRHRDDYPGGVLWVRADSTESLTNDLADFGNYFGAAPDLLLEERAEHVRHQLADLPVPSLLILDSVTDRTDLRLQPPGGLCRILVTARERDLVEPYCRLLPIPPLDIDAALSLLEKYKTFANVAEREAARRIAEAVGSLPLALALVGSHVDGLQIGYGDYARQMGSLFALLEEARHYFNRRTGHDGHLFDTIHLAHRSLEPPAPTVLAAASCFAGQGIARRLLLQACSDLPGLECERAITHLRNSSLVTYEEEGRLSVHALVRLYAWMLMDESERQARAPRAAAVLTRHLQEANEAKDWREFRREMPHCHAAAERCRECGARQALLPLLREIGTYLFEHGDAPKAFECFHEALFIAERLWGRHHLETAFLLKRLGEVEQSLDEPEDALNSVREALSIAETLLDAEAPELADYYNSVGYVLRMRKDYESALHYYHRALQIGEGAYGRASPQVASYLNNIGAVHEAQADWAAALIALNEALDIERTACGPQHLDVAILLNNIGRVLREQGKFPESLDHHRSALEIYEAAFGRQNRDVAMSLRFIGEALVSQGEIDAARENLSESEAILTQIYGPDHPLTRKVRVRLEELNGKPPDAEAL